MQNDLLNAGREADHREEQAVQVEVLKHALNRMPVDTEGNTGHAQIQAAADHVLCCQDVVIGRGDVTRNASCRNTERIQYYFVSSCKYIVPIQRGDGVLYLTRGEARRSRRSRGHLQPRCPPSLPLHQGKDCSPPSGPSPPAGGMAEP